MLSAPIWPGTLEVSRRITQLKKNMADVEMDAILITSKDNFEYYTGYRSLFWLSDTRPLMAIAQRDTPGISIVLNIGEKRNDYCNINADVHPIFYHGFTDAALDAIQNILKDLPRSSLIGIDYGRDMNGRGSLALVDRMREDPHHMRLADAAELIWRQRIVKSMHEFEAKRAACQIATDSFFGGLSDISSGISEYQFGQLLKIRMIGLGADSVDWIPVRFGHGGASYGQPNADRKLENDDFIWVDMGVRRGDQISDLNRIAKVGKPTPEQEDIYAFVRDVTLRLAEGIRPGMTGHDAFALFETLWSARDFSKGGKLAIAGRVGHGSGIALTEPPSLMTGSAEVILEDMVLHVEPKIEIAGGMFQVEEVFRVTPTGPEFLSAISPAKLPSVEL
ncbi:aminopeptidase P family protein [Mesorhizobium sp. SARCC-RB16n]|uniref:M24 family metallopeptidase n=1 Tax=Mesorhizobium sp. SARCC-RB16n TaxID=2116687 RepID=UPI00122F137C|nr:M24 family metallopeptidase [Mesorhizobium sp. SARCC-RB16n]KAA3448196.1 aminopeptidase P family protein [Mesorhizobium sp. SARCC-RB16n]